MCIFTQQPFLFMEKLELKNHIYRWLFVLFGMLSLFILSQSIYSIAIAVTDQNTYNDVSSKIYINKDIPGSEIITKDGIETRVNGVLSSGSLLDTFDNGKPQSKEQISNILSTKNANDSIRIRVLKLTPEDEGFGQIKDYFVRVEDIPNDFFIVLNSVLCITNIEKGGVSDKAGLKTGDLIIKVNGKDFENSISAQRILLNQKKNRTIDYTILRSNEIKNIKIELAKFELAFNQIIIYVIGLYSVFLGLFIGFKRYYLFSARLVGLGLILFGSMTTFSASMAVLVFSNNPALYQWAYIVMVLIGPPTLFTSMIYFPYERRKIQERKYLLYLPFLYSLLLLIIGLYELFISKSIYASSILINTSIIVHVIYYKIIFGIFRDKNKKYDRRFGRAINLSINLNIILITAFSILVATEIISLFGQITFILGLIPLAYTYTLIKYGLLDNVIKVRKNILYTLIFTFINLAIILLTIGAIVLLSRIEYPIPNLHFTGRSIEVLDKPLSEDRYLMYGRIISVIFSLATVYFFSGLQRSITRNLEERFQISKFDYKRALNDISELSQKVSNSNELAKAISEKIASLLRVKRSGVIFFENKNSIGSISFHGINEDKLKEYFIAIEEKLISAIDDFSGNIIVEYLPTDIQKVFFDCNLTHIVPMRSKGKLLGVLMVGDKLSESAFNSDDLTFLRAIGSQSAIGIENMFLYSDLAKQQRIQRELELARQIQLSSLPQEQPNVKGLDISGMSAPALEVGGDFYDFYQYEDNSISLVIGDVSGKGTSAALYMSKIQGIMQTLQDFEREPAKLLTRSNIHIYDFLEKSAFITATCANFNIETRTVKISRAGHLPLYYYNSQKNEVEKIVPKGIVMGLNKGELFERNLEQYEFEYNSGDVFLMVTDGITESRNQSNLEFEENRLIDFLLANKDKNSEAIMNHLNDEVKEFTGKNEQFDDITIVVVKVD